VFELSPSAGGTWTEAILHNFGTNSKDATLPYSGLILDSSGNLYGTTYGGGAHTFGGTAFELSPKARGSWTEKILHSFGSVNDASGPVIRLGPISNALRAEVSADAEMSASTPVRLLAKSHKTKDGGVATKM
jgi:hypothetical protein